MYIMSLAGFGMMEILETLFFSMPEFPTNEAEYVASSVTVIVRGLIVLPSFHDTNLYPLNGVADIVATDNSVSYQHEPVSGVIMNAVIKSSLGYI